MARTKAQKNLFQPGNTMSKGKAPGSINVKARIQKNILTMMDTPVGKEDGEDVLFGEAFFRVFTREAMNPDSISFKIMTERLIEPGVFDNLEKMVNKNRREDLDFLAYRIYKKAFQIQKNILSSPSERLYLMAGRRAGKTEVIRFMIETALAVKEDAKVLYIGRTFTTAQKAVWNEVLTMMDDLGISVQIKNASDGYVKWSNGAEFHVKGNNTVEDRDKLRGGKYHLAIVDEAQTQPGLTYLVQDILEPMLLDFKGQLVLAGTGPKVRGTFWETVWSNEEKFPGERYNWNLTQNPFIPDHSTVLAKIRKDKKITENSPLYLREYLGKISYDDDALVYRLEDHNFFTWEELATWMRAQPTTDIKFTSGLDYGFVDSDGFVIIVWSTASRERFMIFEHKSNRTGVTELVQKIQEGIQFTKTDQFNDVHDRDFSIYCDTSDQKISYELQTQYGIPAVNAYKHNKDFAIEQLQEDVRHGRFKVLKGGVFEEEALKTVFRRDEQDNLTREIDDETFHPDLVDAVLYAMRPVWIQENRE